MKAQGRQIRESVMEVGFFVWQFALCGFNFVIKYKVHKILESDGFDFNEN